MCRFTKCTVVTLSPKNNERHCSPVTTLRKRTEQLFAWNSHFSQSLVLLKRFKDSIITSCKATPFTAELCSRVSMGSSDFETCDSLARHAPQCELIKSFLCVAASDWSTAETWLLIDQSQQLFLGGQTYQERGWSRWIWSIGETCLIFCQILSLVGRLWQHSATRLSAILPTTESRLSSGFKMPTTIIVEWLCL